MIAVTVPFINKRADSLFWKGFSKNLLLPIVASPFKSGLVILKLTRWPRTTSILVEIGRIYRYQFKDNYLKN